MALTDAQKVSAKRALGYNAASAALYPFIDAFHSVNEVLSTLPAATETEVIAILNRIATLETSIDDAKTRLKAAQVGSIVLQPKELSKLWAERAKWCEELSTITGIPLRRKPGQTVI